MGKEEPPAPEFPPQAPVAPPRKVLDLIQRSEPNMKISWILTWLYFEFDWHVFLTSKSYEDVLAEASAPAIVVGKG